jgi:hypothetical protein
MVVGRMMTDDVINATRRLTTMMAQIRNIVCHTGTVLRTSIGMCVSKAK